VTGEQNKPRIMQALEELSGYRDDGEDVIDNLELVAHFHSVPMDKLKELAEQVWGGPLETDRERNADHFEAAARRLTEQAEAQAYRDNTVRKAKEAAIDVWDNCCPNGEPDWGYCAKRFLSSNKVEGASLRIEVTELFQRVGGDFRKSAALYRKWQIK
jgi:hypothetical protein